MNVPLTFVPAHPRVDRRTLTVLATGLCTFMGSGCATKPPPTFDQIQEHAGLKPLGLSEPWRSVATDGPIQHNWIASFNDPALTAIVDEAIINNPDLKVAAIRVESASQQVELARAAMRPTLGLLGTGGLNMGGGDVNSALQGIMLGASWEPDLWGRLRYGRNAAESTSASVRADFEFARQSLAAAVARSWFCAIETRMQSQIAHDMVAAAGELVGLAQQRHRVGAGSEQEIALARASQSTLEESCRQIDFAHEQSLRAVELLLGRYPGAQFVAGTELPTLADQVPAGLPLQMLERRPDLVAAERRVAAAFHRVGEARAARLPRIVLNANIAALRSDVLELKQDFSNPVGGVGARLVAPIYQGGALETNVRIRTTQQKEATAQYAAMAIRALGDVESALAGTQSLQDRRVLLEQVLAQNEHALAIARTQHRIGRADLRLVQQQQLAVHAARASLLRIRSEQLTQRATLHLVLGGCFEPVFTAPQAGPHEPSSHQ